MHAVSGDTEFGQINELIVLCDRKGAIRFVSRAFAEFFGAPVDQWEGKPFAPGNNAAAVGAPAVYATSVKTALGDHVVEWEESVLQGGERLYVGATLSSPSAEELNQPSTEPAKPDEDAKMQFLATMSHEMRTPLNGIIGMTGLLLDTALEPNQRAYAESVRESSTALLALINDLLDYAKIDAGKLELDAEPFCPQSLIQGVAELLSPRAADKGIEITNFIDAKIPPVLYGDEARLRQVLINLCGNGVKFTDTGGVSIEAHLIKKGEAAAAIRMDIRDTGIGIPEKMQAAIFDEFAQADSGIQKRKEGTGLGLSIAQKLVRAMHGDIAIESTPGEGSTFSFVLELDYDDHEDHKRKPIDSPVIIATRSSVLRRNLELQLRSLGAKELLHAKSADEALKAVEDQPNAVLLCDIYLASENQPTFVYSAERSLVMMSPLARDRIGELREAGFQGYLIKPIRQSSLHEWVTGSHAKGAQPPKQIEASPAIKGPKTESFNVLLAEDNQINAVLATAIIKRAGHNVDIATNGAEAVSALEKGDYNIVLMDMHMPEVDGLTAVRKIRKLDSDCASVPVVALTANAMASDRQKCVAAGMDDFISKPFEPDELIEMINKWALSKSDLSQAS